MIPNTENIIENNQGQLKLLEFSLNHRRESILGAIIYEDEFYCSRLYPQIEQTLTNYQHYTLDVGSIEIISLYDCLQKHLPSEILQASKISHIVHVFNLANSMVTYDAEQDRIVASKMNEQVNFERELLFRKIPAIVLLWMDKSSYLHFIRQAVDFKSWLNYVFEFKTPEEEKVYQGEAYSAPLPEKKELDPQVTEQIAYLKGRLEKVDPNLPQMRKQKEKSAIHYLLAGELIKVGRYQEALESLEFVRKHIENLSANDQGKADVYLKIGSAYFLQENDDAALEFFNKILDLPVPLRWHQQAYLYIGAVYENRTDFETAQNFFQKAIEIIQDDNDSSYLGQAFFRLAASYHKTKNWVNALTHYQKALDCFIKEGDKKEIQKTYLQISQVYQEQGRIELAELFALKSGVR